MNTLIGTAALLAVLVAGCGPAAEDDTADDAPTTDADGEVEADGEDGTDGEADGGVDTSVQVTGTDGLEFRPSELDASAGTLEVELTAEEGTRHTFTIEELDDLEVTSSLPGETTTGTVELEPGDYTFYCSVAGHRAAGMEGTLTITE